MSRYLIDKFKGIYRLKASYDLRTNDFPRDENGNIDSSFEDIYIICQNNIEIYHYGGKTLVAYIPSLQRGRNITKELNEINKDIILKYIESDIEVLIHFNIRDIDIVAKLCKARTSGAGISPFSVKNLPKDNKVQYNKYEVPEENKTRYARMIELLKQWTLQQGVRIGDAYNKFYKEFGKSIKVDLVQESSNEHYKIVNIIDIMNLTEKAIKWLENDLEKVK